MIATKTSDFFKSATSGTWKEASEKAIKLPETTPLQFDTYINWLYTGEIPFAKSSEPFANNNERRAFAIGSYDRLMELYEMGYFLLDATFRNAVVTATLEVRSKTSVYPGVTALRTIWGKTPHGCSMKRLIMRFWAKWIKTSEIPDSLSKDFAICLLKEMVDIRDSERAVDVPDLWNKCEYHEHDDKVPKCQQPK